MAINSIDVSVQNNGGSVQSQNETREIRGVKVAPVTPRVEDATRRIQNGQGSAADFQLVKQAALNTQTVNNNLQKGQ